MRNEDKMDFQSKKVLVVGAGKSGIAAIQLLNTIDAHTILYDSNDKLSVLELKEKLPAGYQGEIILGELPSTVVESLDYVVLSPGVPTDLPLVNELRERKITILGEVELAYQFGKGRIAAITGTNGKTTTTTLVGEIMKSYFDSAFVVGNIGLPYTEYATQMKENSVTVAELSSFQLETVHSFRPNVSVILNITPDHLNRHHTMDNYIDAKLRITLNQGNQDVCILNYEDEILRNHASKIKANIMWFSSLRTLDRGLYLSGDEIIYQDGSTQLIVCNVKDLQILGRHNYENVMAAVGICVSLGIPMEFIQKSLLAFQGVEHRIEYVTTKHGVKYYNDSKGTNPDASIKAIKAMQTKTLLIAGGYDKDSNYDEWIQAFEGKVTYLVLLGQTRFKIREAAMRLGIENIVLVDSLEEAVGFCTEHANPGESVLLSPSCASWGMFNNYEERGNMFKEYVLSIKE